MLQYNKLEPLQKLRDIIFSYFIAHPNEASEFTGELEYLRKANNFYDFVIPYEGPNKFKVPTVIGHEPGFTIVDWKGKSLYIAAQNDEQAINYVITLIIEQGNKSPHQYKNYRKSGKYLIDFGAAEGFFALENIDNFENIVLVDKDKNWLNCINKTFEPYKSKTQIIPEFLTENTIDSFEILKEPKNDSVIKLDIEGCEEEIISKLLYLQQSARNIDILVCCYHKESTFKIVSDFANYYNFNIDVNPGYMLFVYDNLRPPFFRKGVVRLYK